MATLLNTLNNIDLYKSNRNDVNGNGRIIVHFLDFLTKEENRSDFGIEQLYRIAVNRAKSIKSRTFKAYTCKEFGGGLICQTDYRDGKCIAEDIATAKAAPVFIKDWSEKQQKKVNKAICEHFAAQNFAKFWGKSFEQIENYFGLPYTSSGNYAGLWVCNVIEYYKGSAQYYYRAFAIAEDGYIYAILTNDEEQEIYIKIGK
jgi:hypothetical protein